MAAKIFDSHLHIIDPSFPVHANQGYTPPTFSVADYQARSRGLGIGGGAVVAGSFQGYDQEFLRAALQLLGPRFVGVAQIPAAMGDAEIASLHAAGVRAVRFNLVRVAAAELAEVEALARRVFDLAGWHSEFYLDARRLGSALSLSPLGVMLDRLPQVVVDHLGLHHAGTPALLRLVDGGVIVKATGFGRVDLDPVDVSRQILARNEGALVIGTDLPSTRARRPFRQADFDSLLGELEPHRRAAVGWDNAQRLYLRNPRPA